MKAVCSKFLLALSIGFLCSGTAIAQPQPASSSQPSIPAASSQQDSIRVIVRDEVDRTRRDILELSIKTKVDETIRTWLLYALPLGGFAVWFLATKWKEDFEKQYLNVIKDQMGVIKDQIAEMDNHVESAKQKGIDLTGYIDQLLTTQPGLQPKNQSQEESGTQFEGTLAGLMRQIDNLLSEEFRQSFEPGQTSSSELQIRLREVISKFEQLPENSKLTAADYVSIGDVFYFANNYEVAKDLYDEALRIEPIAAAWYGKGNALRKQGKYEDSIAAYEEAIGVEPKHFLAWTNLGMATWRVKGYPEAITCVDKAIDIKPNYYRSWYNRACYLARLNKLELAIEALKKAISLEEGNCRELARIDTDFDSIRGDERFLKLLQS